MTATTYLTEKRLEKNTMFSETSTKPKKPQMSKELGLVRPNLKNKNLQPFGGIR